MAIRTHSLEAATAAISLTAGPTLLIETSNQGGDRRYKVMKPLGDAVVDELHFRDAAIVSFDSIKSLQDKTAEIETSFNDEEGTCFATRLTTFENGALIDVLIFGQDYFCSFED